MRSTSAFDYPEPAWSSTRASTRLRIPASRPSAEPCADCPAPCCQTVSVLKSQVIAAHDLELLEDYVAYRGLTAWLDDSGAFSINIVAKCDHLEIETYRCGIHGTDKQPRVCSDFDATSCWYRDASAYRRSGSLKLDAGNWPNFRTLVEIDGAGLVQAYPPAETEGDVALFDIDVTLAFELVTDSVTDDNLKFLCNFTGISVARAPSGWAMVYPTRRMRYSKPVNNEVRNGMLMGSPPSDYVVLDRSSFARPMLSGSREIARLTVGELRSAQVEP